MLEKLSDEWIRSHQDKYLYWKLEKLRPVLSVTAAVIGVAYVMLRRQSLIMTVLSLLVPVTCVVLDICFPAYFTLLYTKQEMMRNTRVVRISLLMPFFLGLAFLAAATFLNLYFTNLLGLLFSGVVFAVIVTAVFLLILPECKGNFREMVGIFVLLAMVGFGNTGQANYWMDVNNAEIIPAVVYELDARSNTLPKAEVLEDLLGMRYNCKLRLSEGEFVTFMIASDHNIRIGSTVPLNKVNGALGLECYCIGIEDFMK